MLGFLERHAPSWKVTQCTVLDVELASQALRQSRPTLTNQMYFQYTTINLHSLHCALPGLARGMTLRILAYTIPESISELQCDTLKRPVWAWT